MNILDSATGYHDIKNYHNYGPLAGGYETTPSSSQSSNKSSNPWADPRFWKGIIMGDSSLLGGEHPIIGGGGQNNNGQPNTRPPQYTPSQSEDDKILGMPKFAAYIGGGVLAIIGVGLAIKYSKK